MYPNFCLSSVCPSMNPGVRPPTVHRCPSPAVIVQEERSALYRLPVLQRIIKYKQHHISNVKEMVEAMSSILDSKPVCFGPQTAIFDSKLTPETTCSLFHSLFVQS
ncbi:hypothetical protein CHARACLAT_031119 [Characodon lateralis]|uniref:Uncharacterized protein n=1 Tax=Characodon lateralis TaxID=208331 RepID=A0ABU7EP31_9TELE|nr:hypothetical protein [Characodon lateralis]